MGTVRSADRQREGERGQILILFVLGLVVLLAASALLIDGANSLVTRRRLQNMGDAAALAGANQVQATGSAHVCSTISSSPPGAPRSDITTAVLASISSNWPSFPTANVTITCSANTDYENQAVTVDLTINASNFFGTAIGYGGSTVKTTSTALNGQVPASLYSVVLLDPTNASFPNGRRGCPSFLISGGPTLTFGGSVIVDSACTVANGGAIASNGNSATVTFASGKALYSVGGYNQGPLTITPTPITGSTAVTDPLIDIEAINYASMTVRSASKLTLNNTSQVLQPGVYTGGIQLKNSSTAVLRPGIYVIDGGGLDIGAQASFCSISSTSLATNCTGFATGDCPDTTCGVLIFNRGTSNGSGAMGAISIGAGATLKLRAYDDRAMAGAGFEYRNLLFWQANSPTPSSTYNQPDVALSGGGSVDISGTVYTPSAKITMGGGSGGSGGATTLTLQFIAWDLEMSGNSTFTFNYSDNDFVRPRDYGLVQ
jgi:Flp pilus assembly protein TadG